MKYKVTWREDSIYSVVVKAADEDEAYEKILELNREKIRCVDREFVTLEIVKVDNKHSINGY